jgi:hypothetical protein
MDIDIRKLKERHSSSMNRDEVKTRVTYFIAFAFFFSIVLSWWNEIYLFYIKHGIEFFNWQAAVMESVLQLGLAALVIYTTRFTITRLKYLEGFLPVCASCKRIRVVEEWVPLELYLRQHSEAEFTHGMCPECIEMHYGEFLRKSAETN